MGDGLRNWVVLAENVRTEIFGALEAITLVWPRSFPLRTCPRGRQDLAPRIVRAKRDYHSVGSEIRELA